MLSILSSFKPDFVLISCLFENEIEIKVVEVNLTSLNYRILQCEMFNFATKMLDLDPISGPISPYFRSSST